jgi:modification methylase
MKRHELLSSEVRIAEARGELMRMVMLRNDPAAHTLLPRQVEVETPKIHLVVTSPPYHALFDYGGDGGQIGFGQRYEDFLQSLNTVWGCCLSLLEPGCKICIVVGDVFVRGTDGQPYFVRPLQADIVRQLDKLGFRTLGNIIWNKMTSTKTSGGGSWMGSIYHPRNGMVTYEHEYIIIAQKPGKSPRPSPGDKEKSRMTKEQRSEWFRGLWKVSGRRKDDIHPAAYPLEIPSRLIRMFSFHGERVLDPFLGSGVTLEAAEIHGRRCTGIELVDEYLPLIEKAAERVEFERLGYV